MFAGQTDESLWYYSDARVVILGDIREMWRLTSLEHRFRFVYLCKWHSSPEKKIRMTKLPCHEKWLFTSATPTHKLTVFSKHTNNDCSGFNAVRLRKRGENGGIKFIFCQNREVCCWTVSTAYRFPNIPQCDWFCCVNETSGAVDIVCIALSVIKKKIGHLGASAEECDA